MNFTREELALIQTALQKHSVAALSPGEANRAWELKRKVQSHLLKDDCPITARCPPSVPA